jgi:glucose/arabinose dehydrogenase
MGFRNPQGLFKINNSEIIFGTDHSSNGGDEINLINKNNNYAWPCISYGKLYNSYLKNWEEDVKNGIYPVIKKINKYAIYPTLEELEDYCDENNSYTDQIYAFQRTKVGISQGIHYDKTYFKQFKDNIIVSTLAGRSLFRFVLNDNKNRIISSEQIYIGNRIRDLEVTIDGKLLALTDNGFLIYIENSNKKIVN